MPSFYRLDRCGISGAEQLRQLSLFVKVLEPPDSLAKIGLVRLKCGERGMNQFSDFIDVYFVE